MCNGPISLPLVLNYCKIFIPTVYHKCLCVVFTCNKVKHKGNYCGRNKELESVINSNANDPEYIYIKCLIKDKVKTQSENMENLKASKNVFFFLKKCFLNGR